MSIIKNYSSNADYLAGREDIKNLIINNSELNKSYKIKPEILEGDPDNIISKLLDTIEFTYNSYIMGKNHWNFTELMIRYSDGEEMHIYHNYSSMCIYAFSYNGDIYLFAQEDYQGFVIINLSKRTKSAFIPESAFKGYGFCITDIIDFDDEECSFRVEGCYWACPFGHVDIKVDSLDNITEIDFGEIWYEDEEESEDDNEEDDDSEE